MADQEEQLAALQVAVEKSPADAKALEALGRALYDMDRGEEAISFWEKAARADRTWALPWRNLGFAYFNVLGDKFAAQGAYQRALSLGRSAEILWERDTLMRVAKTPPSVRLEDLEKNADLVSQSDALRIVAAELLNIEGRFEHAKGLLLARPFATEHAEAAGEQYRRAEIAGLRQAYWRGEVTAPLWQACLEPLASFGGATPGADQRAELHYWLGTACRKGQDFSAAENYWKQAIVAARVGKSQGVATFYAGLSLRELGQRDEAEKTFAALETASRTFEESEPATLPLSPIKQNPTHGPTIRAQFFEALARYGLGEIKMARRLLGDVMRDEPSHALAADFMRWLEW